MLLRLERKLGGEEAVLLRHRGLRSIKDVVHELFAVRELDAAAVDVSGLLLVHEEEVVAAGAARDVHVLADFDEAVRAEDGQTPVAPGAQTVGREPIDADVAGASVAAQHHVAEVLEVGPRSEEHTSEL